MADDGLQRLIGWPTAIFGFVIVVASLVTYCTGWFGFDMDNFGPVKPYFQSSEQRIASSPQDADSFEQYQHPKCFDAAIAYYSQTHSNDASVNLMQLALKRNGEFYETLRTVYSKLETHNRNVALAFVGLFALFFGVLSWQQYRSKGVDDLLLQVRTSGEEIVRQILEHHATVKPSESTTQANDVLSEMKTVQKGRRSKSKK